MRNVLTPAQMAAADRAAIDSGIPSQDLMDRAGRALGRAALTMMGGAYGRRAVILCGKGNNGGDGFVCAAQLARRGVRCTVVTLADPAQLTGDAAWAYRLVTSPGCRILGWDPDLVGRELSRADLAIDAMLGTGFAGTLRGSIARAAELVNASGAPVLAVDIPSGVDGRTGAVEGPAIKAQATVTMGALKVGLLTLPGAEYAGRVEVAGIGIPDRFVKSRVRIASEPDLAAALTPRARSAHKRSVGKLVIAAGSVGMTGAAALCARGAIRAGAGLIRLAVPDQIRSQVAPSVLEVLTTGVPAVGGRFGPSSTEAVVGWAGEWDALALGPGIGRGPEVTEFVEGVLSATSVPVVLDADGLAAFNGRLEWLRSRPGPTILTPHAGELGAMLSIEAPEVEADRIGTAIRAAERSGAIVVLKGFRTVIASPAGEVVIADCGGPMLATAGTGDVLTGMMGALAARMAGFEAAWAAVLLHGLAGERAAQWAGTDAVAATDLPVAAAQVLGRLRG